VPPTNARFAVALALGVACLLYTVACLVGRSYADAFFAIPFFVGFPGGAIYPPRPYRVSLFAFAAALLIAVLTLQEGVVCVLLALPLVLPVLLLGAFSGSMIVSRLRSRRARHGTVGLMIFVGASWQIVDALSDDPRRHPLHAAEAEITIEASPERVFALLTEGNLQIAPRWPWFIRIGLPIPQRMVVEKPGSGGRLRFDFDHGTALARVTTWNAPYELRYEVDSFTLHDPPFHITRLGRSPDYGFRSERVEDWLSIEDTRYVLSRTPSGGTLLYRRLMWRRHLAPDFYFGWLQQTVIERGQVRLLEGIAERARAQSKPTESQQAALLVP